jgi:hypothetical protein
MSVEEPEDDVAEQRRDVVAAADDDQGAVSERRYDVDEADAAEQARAVELDEDEYR